MDISKRRLAQILPTCPPQNLPYGQKNKWTNGHFFVRLGNFLSVISKVISPPKSMTSPQIFRIYLSSFGAFFIQPIFFAAPLRKLQI